MFYPLFVNMFYNALLLLVSIAGTSRSISACLLDNQLVAHRQSVETVIGHSEE